MDNALEKLEAVYLETSSRCNLACSYCYRTLHDYPGKGKLMDFGVFERVLESLKANDSRPSLFLHGFGEPTLHPRIGDMVALAKQSGLFGQVGFVSNLCAVDQKAYREYFRRGLERLFFSLDTLRPELLADTRRGMDLPRALGVLRGLAPDFKGRITPITVLSQANLDQIEELGALFSELGIEEWNVQLHHTHKGGFGVSAQEASEAKAKAAALFPRLTLHFEEPGLFRCRQPFNTLVVNASGHVTPCCSLTNHQVIDFGDAATTDVLACRESQGFRDFRAEFARKRPSACGQCPYYGPSKEHE